MPEAPKIYSANVRALPSEGQENSEWSEEDTRHVAPFSLGYVAMLYPEEAEYT